MRGIARPHTRRDAINGKTRERALSGGLAGLPGGVFQWRQWGAKTAGNYIHQKLAFQCMLARQGFGATQSACFYCGQVHFAPSRKPSMLQR
jgi:hypothetical protein